MNIDCENKSQRNIINDIIKYQLLTNNLHNISQQLTFNVYSQPVSVVVSALRKNNSLLTEKYLFTTPIHINKGLSKYISLCSTFLFPFNSRILN